MKLTRSSTRAKPWTAQALWKALGGKKDHNWVDYCRWHQAHKATGKQVGDFGSPEWERCRESALGYVRAKQAHENMSKRRSPPALIPWTPNRSGNWWLSHVTLYDFIDTLLILKHSTGKVLATSVTPEMISTESPDWLAIEPKIRAWVAYARKHVQEADRAWEAACKLAKDPLTVPYEPPMVEPFDPSTVSQEMVQAAPKLGGQDPAEKGTGGYDLHRVHWMPLLTRAGIYLGPGSGWASHEVQCPWSSGHSAGTGETAGVRDPDSTGPGAFHCFHDSCTGRRASALIQWLTEKLGAEFVDEHCPRFVLPGVGGAEVEVPLGAEENAKLIVPRPWKLDKDGLHREGVTKEGETYTETILTSPIVIKSIDHDIDSGTQQVTIGWMSRGRAHSARVPRTTIARTRDVADLALHGCPVNSLVAPAVVEYLTASLKANEDLIPHTRTTGRLGWQGEKGFLLGTSWVGDEDSSLIHSSDGGIAQIAGAIRAEGRPEEQEKILSEIGHFPRIMATVGAALAAPLLRPLGARGFVLSLSGETSTGKTTAMRVAGGIYGLPDESSQTSVLRSWDATRIWIERTATGLDGIPFLLDDTQRASPGVVARTLYDVPSGGGRGRASKDGSTQRTEASRTILISSGETPALDASTAGGVRGRVLELWGAPWGASSAETAEMVRRINASVLAHYGHAGQAWIRFLVDHRADWEEWRQARQSAVEELSRQAATSGVTNRLCEYIATIHLALNLASRAGIAKWSSEQVSECIDVLRTECIREAADRDMPREAMLHLCSTIVSRKEEFEGKRTDKGAPLGGYAGKWEHGLIALSPPWVDRVLTQGKFDPSVTRIWAARGWLETEGRHIKKKVSMEGSRVRAYVLDIGAIARDTGAELVLGPRLQPSTPPSDVDSVVEFAISDGN